MTVDRQESEKTIRLATAGKQMEIEPIGGGCRIPIGGANLPERFEPRRYALALQIDLRLVFDGSPSAIQAVPQAQGGE